MLALEHCITPLQGSWLLGPDVVKLEYILFDELYKWVDTIPSMSEDLKFQLILLMLLHGKSPMSFN